MKNKIAVSLSETKSIGLLEIWKMDVSFPDQKRGEKEGFKEIQSENIEIYSDLCKVSLSSFRNLLSYVIFFQFASFV